MRQLGTDELTEVLAVVIPQSGAKKPTELARDSGRADTGHRRLHTHGNAFGHAGTGTWRRRRPTPAGPAQSEESPPSKGGICLRTTGTTGPGHETERGAGQ